MNSEETISKVTVSTRSRMGRYGVQAVSVPATPRRSLRSGNRHSVGPNHSHGLGASGVALSADAVRAAKLREALGDGVIEPIDRRIGYRAIKRLFDILFSAVVLVALSWLYLIVALAIKLEDPKGPVFFRQERVGKDGKPFQMLKFRSMVVDAEARLAELQYLNEKTGPVFKIADDPRITKAGKIIRKLSIDEFPQFINTLRGDMSVVGPRPALPKEVAQYTPYQRQRLKVKPGITCYWQTRMNRDLISFDEWVDLDLLYIQKCGVWTDMKLIIQTVGCVLTAQGN